MPTTYTCAYCQETVSGIPAGFSMPTFAAFCEACDPSPQDLRTSL